MRTRGIRSPDDWDAIALTFAEPVYEEIEVSPVRMAGAGAPGGWMG